MVYDDDDEEVGARVRAIRERMGLTQHDVMMRSEGRLRSSMISKLERGRLRWTVSRVREFAALLGVTVAEVMGESDTAAA